MNPLKNLAGLVVVLGSFTVACSTEAGGVPEAKGGSESAETAGTEPAKKDAKESDAAKGDTAKTDDKTGFTIPGVPSKGADGADGEDGEGDGMDFPDFPAGGAGDGADGAGNGGGISTNGGHAAANNDCCFQGQYFECPDANACFGGFDVNACIGACGNDFNCVMDCSGKLSTAGGPKGCTQKAAPANIKCQ